MHGFAGRDVENTGPYHLPVEGCGVKFLHYFYTLESQIPCAAGYDLICAAKVVIDSVLRMVWSYWHVDLYATPSQPPTPSLLPVSTSTAPTSVSPADEWIADCFRLVGLDHPNTVETSSTDSPQRPCDATSPSTHLQSLSTLLPSSSPCALSAFQYVSDPQELDNLQRTSIMQVEADTPFSDPLDSICSQVPEHIRVLFLTTVTIFLKLWPQVLKLSS